MGNHSNSLTWIYFYSGEMWTVVLCACSFLKKTTTEIGILLHSSRLFLPVCTKAA